MKLINDIINELVDSEKSINSALLKTKVLASRLQNTDLLNWVSNELKGYSKNEELPKYRIHKGILTGTYTNGSTQYNKQPIPVIGLDKKFIDLLLKVRLDQSISSLENLINDNNKSDKIGRTFPAEITGMIQQNWREMGNPYLQLINCNVSVSVNVANEIISIVRNNLLDFMLKIDAEFGNITEIEELKTKKEEILTIMNQTIINNTGDGSIINTGENSKIIADININKGNKDELKRYLQEIGISDSDTFELIEIIDSEEPNLEKKTFGKKVNEWTTKMLSKALDGSWNIGIGTAGTILGEIIKKYYGM